MVTKINEREAQRVFMHHETVCLAVFACRWFQAEEMQYTDQYRQERCMDVLHQLLGGPVQSGWLQIKMNRQMNGIFERLCADMPLIRHEEILILSYSACGFTNEMSAHLAGLSSANCVSVIRCRLREKIQKLDSAYTEEYLSLLPRRTCRIGEEMLYLSDRKYRKLWKLQ